MLSYPIPDEAEPVVKQLIAMEPTDTGSYFALVRIYEDAGKIEDAEEILKQAQAAAPDKADVWSQSALFYNRKGEFDRAMDSFQRITQIVPKNPQNYYQMSVFHEEKVRKDFIKLAAGRLPQQRYEAGDKAPSSGPTTSRG
jgi:tetratricopeptide (TPR) repeat protein